MRRIAFLKNISLGILVIWAHAAEARQFYLASSSPYWSSHKVRVEIIEKDECKTIISALLTEEAAVQGGLAKVQSKLPAEGLASASCVRQLVQESEPNSWLPSFPGEFSADADFTYVQLLNNLKLRADSLDYPTRALIGRFESYLRRGGQLKNADLFCQENEDLQYRSKRYADSGHKIYIFHGRASWDALWDTGLSEAELSAIQEYTLQDFRQINSSYWSGKPVSENLRLEIDTLNDSLRRLPNYSGMVKRFSALPPAVLDQHQPGKIVKYAAFTSTTKDQSWTWGAMYVPANSKQELLIFGINGRDISTLSGHPKEAEVLFPAGTRFKVLARSDLADGRSKIVLAEVDENGNVLGQIPSEYSAQP